MKKNISELKSAEYKEGDRIWVFHKKFAHLIGNCQSEFGGEDFIVLRNTKGFDYKITVKDFLNGAEKHFKKE